MPAFLDYSDADLKDPYPDPHFSHLNIDSSDEEDIPRHISRRGMLALFSGGRDSPDPLEQRNDDNVVKKEEGSGDGRKREREGEEEDQVEEPKKKPQKKARTSIAVSQSTSRSPSKARTSIDGSVSSSSESINKQIEIAAPGTVNDNDNSAEQAEEVKLEPKGEEE